ncbi:MRP family ATP-binding protein, partial [Paenibacillus pasadenensis]|nr:MRP family ATP-binding protein [Paenibacillus pasadenensis]
MLTREQVLEAVNTITAQGADGIAVRDSLVKDRQASLTVLMPGGAAQPPVEAALREALARLGAETVHLRVRPREAAG